MSQFLLRMLQCPDLIADSKQAGGKAAMNIRGGWFQARHLAERLAAAGRVIGREGEFPQQLPGRRVVGVQTYRLLPFLLCFACLPQAGIFRTSLNMSLHRRSTEVTKQNNSPERSCQKKQHQSEGR